jgi:hypothetical protein
VHIGSLEDVQALNQNQDQRGALKAVGTIAMELMEKHAKKNDAAGVNDLKRWPADSDAVKFLAAIDSVSTVDNLRKVRQSQLVLNSQSHILPASFHNETPRHRG